MACSKGPPLKLKGPPRKPKAAWILEIEGPPGKKRIIWIPADKQVAEAASLPWKESE